MIPTHRSFSRKVINQKIIRLVFASAAPILLKKANLESDPVEKEGYFWPDLKTKNWSFVKFYSTSRSGCSLSGKSFGLNGLGSNPAWILLVLNKNGSSELIWDIGQLLSRVMDKLLAVPACQGLLPASLLLFNPPMS